MLPKTANLEASEYRNQKTMRDVSLWSQLDHFVCQDQVKASLTWLTRHFVWNEQHIYIHCREIILIHLKCSCKCQ